MSFPHVLALFPTGASAPEGSSSPIEGVRIHLTRRPEAFLSRLSEREWDLVLVSLSTAGVDAAWLRDLAPRLTAPLLLSVPELTMAVSLAAEQAGASGLLREPIQGDQWSMLVTPLLEERVALAVPPARPEARGDPAPQLLGASAAMEPVFRAIARLAPTSAPLLVTGEPGTGKETVARVLHRSGPRSAAAFVVVETAEFPGPLLAEELFGLGEPDPRAGTSAAGEGRVIHAHGGTLFLDGILDISLPVQSRILRMLETGVVEPVGGSPSPVPVDVRIVGAARGDVGAALREGRLRPEFLERIAIGEIHLPPLRDRGQDLLDLTVHFSARFAHRYGRPLQGLSRTALDRIRGHAWPGNVRELRNVMDRAVLLSRGGIVRAGDIQPDGGEGPERSLSGWHAPTLSLEEVESRHIAAVLAHTGGHMGNAARILGIHRNTLAAKMRRYGLGRSRRE